MTLEAFKHSRKHNVCSITTYNKWDSVYLILLSLKNTVLLRFQVSSRSDSQNEYVPDEIRSMKVDDEHPTKSKENTTMPKEVIPGNDSRVSLWTCFFCKLMIGKRISLIFILSFLIIFIHLYFPVFGAFRFAKWKYFWRANWSLSGWFCLPAINNKLGSCWSSGRYVESFRRWIYGTRIYEAKVVQNLYIIPAWWGLELL